MVQSIEEYIICEISTMSRGSCCRKSHFCSSMMLQTLFLPRMTDP